MCRYSMKFEISYPYQLKCHLPFLLRHERARSDVGYPVFDQSPALGASNLGELCEIIPNRPKNR